MHGIAAALSPAPLHPLPPHNPCLLRSDKERQRGEHEAWGTDGANGVGLLAAAGGGGGGSGAGVSVKYAFDRVFGGAVSNADIFEAVGRPAGKNGNRLARPMRHSCSVRRCQLRRPMPQRSLSPHQLRAAVATVLDGYNSTIFAYGVTSSGKTHTMMGSSGASLRSSTSGGCSALRTSSSGGAVAEAAALPGGEDPGLVPRTINSIFAAVRDQQQQQQQHLSARTFSVKLSMLEIYNEVINDLLDPSKTNLRVQEDGRRPGMVVVDGLTDAVVTSAEAALALIRQGQEARKVGRPDPRQGSSREPMLPVTVPVHAMPVTPPVLLPLAALRASQVGATTFNDDSSRSHTLCRLAVESSPADASTGRCGLGRVSATLTLVDLAGSESARAVISKGQRVEGGFINRSLLTLGTVIHKLADAAAGGGGHIPFRDSKLTRLLQVRHYTCA